jgi:hypothetical protein
MGGGGTGSGGSTGSGGTGTTGSGGSTTGGGSGGATVTQPTLVTSAPGSYWNTSATWSVVNSGTADVTVNDSQTAQTCS